MNGTVKVDRRPVPTRAETRKAAAARLAAQRGLAFNARDLYARIQEVKAVHAQGAPKQ